VAEKAATQKLKKKKKKMGQKKQKIF